MKRAESQLRQVVRQKINEEISKSVFTVRFVTNGAVQEERSISAASLHELLQEIITIQSAWEERFKRGIDDPDEWVDEWVTYGEVTAINGNTDPILLSRVNIRLEKMEDSINSR